MEEIYNINEKAAVFEKIGLNRIEAKILALFFRSPGTKTGREIENILDLRQPEVSLAMKRLQAQGWVREVMNTQDSRRGRPEKVYELSMKSEMIIQDLETHLFNEYTEKLREINRLKPTKIDEPLKNEEVKNDQN